MALPVSLAGVLLQAPITLRTDVAPSLVLDHPGLDPTRPFHLLMQLHAETARAGGAWPMRAFSTPALRELARRRFIKHYTDGSVEVLSWPSYYTLGAHLRRDREKDRTRQRKHRQKDGAGCPHPLPGPDHAPWTDGALPPRTRARVVVSCGDLRRCRFKGLLNLELGFDRFIVEYLAARGAEASEDGEAWGYTLTNWTKERREARRNDPWYVRAVQKWKRARAERAAAKCHADIKVRTAVVPDLCTDFRELASLKQHAARLARFFRKQKDKKTKRRRRRTSPPGPAPPSYWSSRALANAWHCPHTPRCEKGLSACVTREASILTQLGRVVSQLSLWREFCSGIVP